MRGVIVFLFLLLAAIPALLVGMFFFFIARGFTAGMEIAENMLDGKE